MSRRRPPLLLAALALVALIPAPAATGTPLASPSATVPGARNCPIFPSTNVWNKTITHLPRHPRSDVFLASIGLDAGLHPDFGSYLGYGIPYNVVGSTTPRSRVRFQYADESDHVGYPIPSRPKIEGGDDRHILMVDRDRCRLYELFYAVRTSTGWTAGSGATWDLRSNALRPAGWTSADAAGLPILPGLVRYDEVANGAIRHALRFTARSTRRAYIYPARHFASSSSSLSLPPMGLRVRLKASFSLAGYTGQARVVLVALKRYGMILADNGSPWFISGASDTRFNDDDLRQLKRVKGRDLEVVNTAGFVNG